MSTHDPQPQSVVWERMNVPVARALRGLLYVLWDLSQVDPSDLSCALRRSRPAAHRLFGVGSRTWRRSSDDEMQSRRAEMLGQSVLQFPRAGRTSLICIQGPWSNVADAKIKSLLAAQARRSGSAPTTRSTRGHFTCRNPGVSRHCLRSTPAITTPSTSTGRSSTSLDEPALADHSFVDLESARRAVPLMSSSSVRRSRTIAGCFDPSAAIASFPTERHSQRPGHSASFWDLALAMNRSRSRGSEVAQNGADADVARRPGGAEKAARHGVVPSGLPRACRPRGASGCWTSWSSNVVVPNHLLRLGRRDIRLRDLGLAQLKELFSKSSVSEAVRDRHTTC